MHCRIPVAWSWNVGQGEVQREFRNADIYRSTKKVENAEENRELPTYRKTSRTKKVQTAEKKDIHTEQNSFEFFFYPFVEEEMRKIEEGN